MMGQKLKRQPVASTSKPLKRIIVISSSEEDSDSIPDMVQTRSARKKVKETRISSEDESLDESEILSDEGTSEDADQTFSDDLDESTIATRSKRRVGRINYSDEKYFRSRLGNDPDDSKRKKTYPENESGKKRLKISNSGEIYRSTNRNKENVNAKRSKYYKKLDDDNEDSEDDDESSSNHEFLEENLDQSSEEEEDDDDDSGSESSKPIIDPVSSMRANDPQFIAAHLTWCKKCGSTANRHNIEKGPLVLCEYCSNSYHSTCYSRKTTNSKIICQQCSKIDSHISKCMVCHKESIGKVNNSKNKKDSENSNDKDSVSDLDSEDSQVFFRCLYCSQAIHESCMPFLNEEEGLEDKMESYRESWKCHLCLKWEDKVDKILTYRKISADNDDNQKEGSMEVSESQDTLQSEDISADSDNIEDYEFLVKFEDMSYIQVEWVPGPWLYGTSPTKYNNYIKSQPDPLTKEEVIQDNWTKIHRILDVQFKNEVTLRDQFIKGQKKLGRGTPVQAYVKWKGLNYFDATWEPIKNLDRKKFDKAYQIRKNAYAVEKPDIFVNRTFVPHTVQPSYIKSTKYDNTLKDYQLDGVNWLLHNWCNEISCILADEMGLGKTIQIIVFLLILYKERKCHPFLIVAPKSTTAGWSREFKRWAKELNVVEYHGDKESLKIVEDLEMFPDGTFLKCHVIITTPEAIQQHTNTFSKVPLWEVLVVDEAHSLKRGQESLLFKTLNKKFDVYHKVLLTGTPMMNCIDELFNLLKFLGHKEFENPKELAEEYQGLPTADQLPALHKLLKTYFLRRTKSQVNLGLPPMDDVIVRVSMTPIQKTIYKETFEKNAEFLKQVSRTNRSTGFTNILMSLRQIVCHPYIINREEIDPEDERTEEQEEERKKKLVETSGKLILLRDMLKKLHGTEHRVLIFSQFISVLSILEEFLEDLEYKFVKLDGSTDNEVRQYNINAFQAPDSDIFVFLLSTRAGGVGLNLMAADTVFIFDPDFNPHQDIQALSRVHRIGQFKPVKVFRFITQFSIEEKIVEKGKIKLAKNELVVEKMDNEVLDVQEVDDIIRYGAKALFSEDENEKPIGPYTDEAIEKLLDRSQMKAAEQVTESKNLTGFAFARIWDSESQEVVEEKIIANADEEESVESRDFWAKLLAHVANNAAAEEVPLQGRGARKRNKVDYYEGDITTPKKKQGKKRLIDPDFVPIEKDDIVSSETDTSSDTDLDDDDDPLNKKPVISKGILQPKKKKDDGQKSKRSKQSRQDYVEDMQMQMAITGSDFQNTVPVYQNTVGSTSFTQEVYSYSNNPPYNLWRNYYYDMQQYQVHQHQQAQRMPIIQPQQQAVTSPNHNTLSIKTNIEQSVQSVTEVFTLDTFDSNSLKSKNDAQSSQPIKNNALVQSSVSKIMKQQSISVQSVQSNVHNPINIPAKPSSVNNHFNIPMQSVMTMPPEHPNSQSQVQQYQPQYQPRSPTNMHSRNVVIKEVRPEDLKRKIDKTSTQPLKFNGQQALLQEPVVIISDDEAEMERKLPQNGGSETSKNRSVAEPLRLQSSSITKKSTSKNKGKQAVSNINSKNGHNHKPFLANNNHNQNAINSRITPEKIAEFVRLFDEIQMSEEDFGLRLIAITRLHHKLTSLGYDIEGHIDLLAENGKLDHNLLKSFRNAS